MKDSFLSSEGRIGQVAFVIRLVLLVALTAAIYAGAHVFFQNWHKGDYMPLAYFVGLVVAIFNVLVLLMQLLKRLKDMGKPIALSILLLVPGLNILLLIYAAAMPSKSS